MELIIKYYIHINMIKDQKSKLMILTNELETTIKSQLRIFFRIKIMSNIFVCFSCNKKIMGVTTTDFRVELLLYTSYLNYIFHNKVYYCIWR